MEAAIAHVRRLLDGKFARNQVHESSSRFRSRAKRITDHMNLPDLEAPDRNGLLGLGKELWSRCEALIKARLA